jgi:hypothetical protein
MDKILKLNGREKAVLSKALIVSGLDPAQRDALLACAAMTYWSVLPTIACRPRRSGSHIIF